jgi:hypothetical protein
MMWGARSEGSCHNEYRSLCRLFLGSLSGDFWAVSQAVSWATSDMSRHLITYLLEYAEALFREGFIDVAPLKQGQ